MSYKSTRLGCAATGRKYTEYSGPGKDPEGTLPCPECGKVVKLRKQGLDRFPSTIPYHHSGANDAQAI
ncbi:hypothetical protein [Delftia acidovorans]|uniref:hypothetical protein n=1 Tax=Delftia acidovorans TaxID=80866 RepID=UPI001EE10AA4|nr:hypothetical protein [Delftia acidovorans]MCG3782734.1 hypothetical protein [Delftia acidovorans]